MCENVIKMERLNYHIIIFIENYGEKDIKSKRLR